MAELTKLEAKLGEVTGLAMAAQDAGKKVKRLAEGEADDLVQQLEQMVREAAETEERCVELASGFEGKKTAILDEARATKSKASEMLSTYLDSDSDALDGFEFLTMAEAGELGHWAVLQELTQRAGNAELQGLVEWALPIQQRHFAAVSDGSLKLAAEEDPSEPA
ncbi:MAG: hypothetical protein ICV64_02420 [Thermoleophilia bacterium]|nr:hypothetical protein [Thermoleophilia bacterium]